MFYHSVDEFTTKILHNQTDVICAKHLLYKIYVQDQNWPIFDNNPSGIKIKVSKDQKMILIDDYDRYSTWVGTFYNDKLIACGRIIGRDHNGLLEIERYPISNVLKAKIAISVMPNLVELNRSAIHQDYRNTVTWPCLLHFAFKYCGKQKLNAISTTGYQKVIDMHKAIGFEIVDGEGFKYHPADETRVEVFLASTSSNIDNITKNLEKIIKEKLSIISSPHHSLYAKF
ncbi:MAG TPA: GNAT family N-acyltransferase [Gammaproteobacteria bacterium]|nr:GNAT family N-acyltransferase [Gammaproteobacteria bacterium]